MGARHVCVLSAGKPPMPIKILLLGGGGGVVGFLEGGGCESADFIVVGVGSFLNGFTEIALIKSQKVTWGNRRCHHYTNYFQ